MSEVNKINLNDTLFDLEDTIARESISEMQANVANDLDACTLVAEEDGTLAGAYAVQQLNESLENISLNEYSTENNVKVGTWYDGKTLYRKVYTFNSNGAYTLDLPQNVAEVFTLNDCVLFRSASVGSATSLYRTNPYFTSTNDYWNTYIDFTAKSLTIRQAGQNGTTVYVIPVYYTLNS